MIERLLFVADFAVSEVDDLPVAARAVFDAASPITFLVGLRSFEHATWQEHGLIEGLEARYELPVTTYAVDPAGHSLTANGSLLRRDALVLSVGKATAPW